MRAISILGGRPHLIKGESVHAALGGCIQHDVVRVRLADDSDYPVDGDFDLPDPLRTITAKRPIALARSLSRALADHDEAIFLVYGDLRSTAASLLALQRDALPFVHIEAGYRSRDLNDPEEITRRMADRYAAAHLVYSSSMRDNLLAEGVSSDGIFVAPDPARLTLVRRTSSAKLSSKGSDTRALVTFHHDESFQRPRLHRLVRELARLAIRWPLHVILYKRTRAELERTRLLRALACSPGVRLSDTLRYDEYMRALASAPFVVTDSSGVQDDCVTTKTACVVIREASPRPLEPPLTRLHAVNDREWQLPEQVARVLYEPARASNALGEGNCDGIGVGRLREALHAAIAHAGAARESLHDESRDEAISGGQSARPPRQPIGCR